MSLVGSALLISSAVLLLGSVSSKLMEPVQFTSPMTITPDYSLKSHFLQPNVVFGSNDCGGSGGETHQITHTACVTGIEGICATAVNRPGLVEAYFIPSENLNDVVIRSSIHLANGENVTFNVPMPGMTLITGQPYVYSVEGYMTKEVLGKFFTAKMEILNKKNKNVHICAVADFIAYSDE